jgi:hypothetical protein
MSSRLYTKEEWNEITNYTKTQKHILATTRFSNETWNENRNYIEKHSKIGCIYCTTEPISQGIEKDRIIFVLEMNNSINKIMGIGMIRNKMVQPHNVYKNQEYNRYTYMGKIRIDRSTMNEDEENMMRIFDILCFKGQRHLKRLRGIKTFCIDVLYNCREIININEFIGQMFKKRMKSEPKYIKNESI